MLDYIIVSILLAFSALFSGLTLGLMSLDVPELKRKMSLGNKDAERVYAVRHRGNLLLTTLLVGNVAINSTLAIFLGSIASGLVAGLLSTCLIVVFGEIIPQAACSRYALVFGAKTAWMVRIFICIFYPITAPIAWLLNKALGEELGTIYSKKELIKIVEEHEHDPNSEVDSEEAHIIEGALTFSSKMVRDIMTPRTVVYALSSSRIVDQSLIEEFVESGFSRVPVYKDSPDNIIAVVLLRNLLFKDAVGKTIEQVADGKVSIVSEETKLDDLLLLSINERVHLHIVGGEFGGMSGVVSLEDILEEILKIEIVDEDDAHVDMRAYARKHKNDFTDKKLM